MRSYSETPTMEDVEETRALFSPACTYKDVMLAHRKMVAVRSQEEGLHQE
jgi:hypothetical protein